MVRITTIKVNIDFLKLSLLLFFLIIITAFLLIKLLPGINKVVTNTDISFFKKAVSSTLIINDTESQAAKLNTKKSFDRAVEMLVGFNLNRPYTILNYEFAFLKDRNTDNDASISESIINELDSYDNTEESKAIDDQNTEKQIQPEVVTKETVTNTKGITLVNETNYAIDVEDFLSKKTRIPGDAYPQVLIYHTHTLESFLPSKKYKFVQSDTDRIDDPNYNVIRVGDELTNILRKQYNVSVIHDKTIHDGDSYNRAYTKSQKTLEGYIKKYPKLGLVIDIHRDAANIGGKKLRTIASVNNENVAQVMTVIGTDGRGVTHPNWRDNLTLGLKFAKRMNEMYPGISKGVSLKLGRFNQYLSKNAILVEVGANGNTLDETLRSSNYIAQGIVEVLKNAK